MVKYKDIRGLSEKNKWDYENGFYWHSPQSRIGKLISHYELYKTITSLPGNILEFGVYKASSLVRFATFRNMLENDFSRKIIGFDAFGNFPKEKLELEDDLKFIKSFEEAGGDGLSKAEVNQILLSKGFSNFDLIEGNVFETLPLFLKNNPEMRIALLHLDMDVKEPTEFVVEELFEKLVPGGLIVFDDYSTVAGETIFVDEFSNKHKLKLEKLSFYKIPTFIRKPFKL